MKNVLTCYEQFIKHSKLSIRFDKNHIRKRVNIRAETDKVRIFGEQQFVSELIRIHPNALEQVRKLHTNKKKNFGTRAGPKPPATPW